MRQSFHSTLLRVQVGLMVAFYAVALCRGLIPGLCATQNALDMSPPKGAVTISHGCCSGTTDPAPAPSTNETHCAFCSLVTTVAHAVDAPSIPPVESVEQPLRLDGQTAPHVAVPHDPILRRGPPALA